jgi:hypothetical protein
MCAAVGVSINQPRASGNATVIDMHLRIILKLTALPQTASTRNSCPCGRRGIFDGALRVDVEVKWQPPSALGPGEVMDG